MKRMICLVSEQILPNYIPVNEPATRPGILYGMYTPMTAQKWENLKTVFQARHPGVVLEDVPIADAYDAKTIRAQCGRLIAAHPDDAWVLNATGGTKVMAASALDAVRGLGGAVFYVETPRGCILEILPDWSLAPVPFEASIDLETYFNLHGMRVDTGQPVNDQERILHRQLDRLDWRVWASVKLYNGAVQLAEYDAIGIQGYRLFVFECKRVSDWLGVEAADDKVQTDLYKLTEVRQHFGGPFGNTYWVYSGSHKLRDVDRKRIEQFRITFIDAEALKGLANDPEKFGLPSRKSTQTTESRSR